MPTLSILSSLPFTVNILGKNITSSVGVNTSLASASCSHKNDDICTVRLASELFFIVTISAFLPGAIKTLTGLTVKSAAERLSAHKAKSEKTNDKITRYRSAVLRRMYEKKKADILIG